MKKYSGPLSVKEIEVLQLICDQYTNPEIGQILKVSIRTVDSRRERLLKKTASKNIAGMVLYAIRNKLYKP